MRTFRGGEMPVLQVAYLIWEDYKVGFVLVPRIRKTSLAVLVRISFAFFCFPSIFRGAFLPPLCPVIFF